MTRPTGIGTVPVGSTLARLNAGPVGRFARFAAIGVAATALHGALAWLLVGAVGPVAANAIAFTVALVVTYVGNYHLTFRSTAAHRDTVARFLVVSLATLGASEWVLVALTSMNASDRVSLALAVAVLPLLRFGLLARQVFGVDVEAQPLTAWATEIAVWAAAVGVGIVALVVMAPPGLLDPTSELWRLPPADIGAGVAGMRYYLADSWHWPLLRTDDLAAPEGTVIAFTDSLPILALPVKLLRPLLGADLNYFPTWYLITHSAQGPAAVAVLRSLRVRRPEVLVAGAALAVTMPSFVFRVGHPALSGHFLLLLALAAAISIRANGADRWRLAALGFTLVAAVATHPYLFLMSLPLVVGITLDGVRLGRVRLARLAVGGAAVVGAVAAFMAAGGYMGSYGSLGRYGNNGLNLASPLWPQMSGLAPGPNPILAVEPHRWEGMNWLGFGALTVVAAAVVTLIRRRELGAVARRWWVTAVAAVALTALSTTHVITYGRTGVLDLRGPIARVLGLTGADGAAILERGESALSVVRASGRLWWPVGLLVVLAAVAAMQRLPRRLAAVVLVVAVAAQMVDTAPVRDRAEAKLAEPAGLAHPDAVVAAAAASSSVRIEPEFFCTPYPDTRLTTLDVEVAASLAATPVNTAYTARPPAEVDCADSERLLTRQGFTTDGRPGEPGPGELVVLVAPATEELAGLILPGLPCRSDGQLVLCRADWAGAAPGDTEPFLPVLSEPLTFPIGGDAGPHRQGRWPDPEANGTPIPDRPVTVGIDRPRSEIPAPVGEDEAVTLALDLELSAAEPSVLVVAVGDDAGNQQRITVPAGRPTTVRVTLPTAIGLRADDEIPVRLWAEQGRPVLATLTAMIG